MSKEYYRVKVIETYDIIVLTDSAADAMVKTSLAVKGKLQPEQGVWAVRSPSEHELEPPVLLRVALEGIQGGRA